MGKKSKKFLNLPQYLGGKEEFKKFIKENLVYPEEAKKAGVEGTVYLKAEVDDNGKVLTVGVEKGLGYGCDEEAIRLVKLMKFGAVKNIGKRVKTKKRLRINFKLDKQNKKEITYSYKVENKGKKPAEKGKYNYTITFNKPK